MLELFLGNSPGPMGATHVLVVAACLLYLIVRRAAKPELPLTFLAVCALFAFIFPRSEISGVESVIFELTSGFILDVYKRQAEYSVMYL